MGGRGRGRDRGGGQEGRVHGNCRLTATFVFHTKCML